MMNRPHIIGFICLMVVTAVSPAMGQAKIDESKATTTVYVAPNGVDGNAGTREAPLSLQRAIDNACAAGQATKIVLLDGEYRPKPKKVYHLPQQSDTSLGSYVIPHGDNLLIFEAANPGKVRITGADPVKATTEANGVYSVPWTLDWGVAGQVFNGNPGDNGSTLRRELLFVEGKRMTPRHHGPAKNGKPVEPTTLGPGEFTVNEDEDKIYFKPPAGVTIGPNSDVQVSVRGTGMGTGGGYNTFMRTRCLVRVEGHSNIVFRGIEFSRHANYINIDAALEFFFTEGRHSFNPDVKNGPVSRLTHNVLIEDCSFVSNNGGGLTIKGHRQVTVRNCVFRDNGERGLHTGLIHDFLMEDCRFTENGWRFGPWLTGHTASGWKHIEGPQDKIPSRNVVARRCVFRKNSKGMWQDYGGAELTLDRCLIEDNEVGGFMNEMTKARTIVTDCIIRNNGKYNVMLYGARGTVFKDCYIYGAQPKSDNDKSIYCNNFILHSDGRPDNAMEKAPGVTGTVIDSCTIIATTDMGNNFWAVDWRPNEKREPALVTIFQNTTASDFNTWYVRGKCYYGKVYFLGNDGSPEDHQPDLSFEQWRNSKPSSGFLLDAHSKWEDPGDDKLAALPDPTVKPPGNQAPSAIPDTVETKVDKPVTIMALDNDFDADGDACTITVLTQPTMGAVKVSGDTLIYTPNAGFVGGDVFRYQMKDAKGKTDSAMVCISVRAD